MANQRYEQTYTNICRKWWDIQLPTYCFGALGAGDFFAAQLRCVSYRSFVCGVPNAGQKLGEME